MGKNTNEKQTNGARAVVVTTAHRGVFFGYAENTDGAIIKLSRARNCIYWSTAMQGFIGLASIGPDKECKVGPVAPVLELRDITSVVECTPGAVDRWESAGFGR